jgi:hypothetical protein
MQHPKTLRSDVLQAVEACAGWNSRLASRRITQFLEERMILNPGVDSRLGGNLRLALQP